MLGLHFVHCLFYHAVQRRASEKKRPRRATAGVDQALPNRAGRPSHCPHEEIFMPFESDQNEIPADRAAEELFDAHAESIVREAIALAERGDPTALRLCLDRISPPLRERPPEFALPPLATPADAAAAIAAIVAGLADGSLSTAETLDLARFVRTCVETRSE